MLKRNDIINRLSEKGYTKKDAGEIIDDFVLMIAEALVEGEEVMFRSFGTFYIKDVAPRETTDLVSKERIVIPGHRAPKFAPGKQLKRWIREGVIRD